MQQHIPQEEVRRIIISDMMKKRKNISDDELVMEILVDATKLLKEELERGAEERGSMIDAEEHFDVFISYASDDRLIATAIFVALKNLNVKAWFDDRGKSEMTPRHPYWAKIGNGINQGSAVYNN